MNSRPRADPPAQDRPATNELTLVAEDVHVAYGRSIQALNGIDLTVRKGTVTAVLGANGAGKSTLMRTISGVLHHHRGALTSGSITFQGENLARRSAAAIARAGIVQSPEGRRVFTSMSVEDNLRVGAMRTPHADRRAARERVTSLFPILHDRRDQPAGLLSGGEQQMLAMGRALMAGPRLLLLDEPSLGLAPKIVHQIAQIVQQINQQGTTILLVEQNARMALSISDDAIVLENGAIRLSGTSAALAKDPAVQALYLGEPPTADLSNGPAVETPTLRRWDAAHA